MKKTLFAVLVLILIVAVAVWAIRKHPRATQTPPQAVAQSVSTSTPGTIQGSIETLNDDGFALTVSDGSVENILVTGTTTVLMMQGTGVSTTTLDQLNVGQQVSVMGSQNPDGSVTASKVLVQ